MDRRAIPTSPSVERRAQNKLCFETAGAAPNTKVRRKPQDPHVLVGCGRSEVCCSCHSGRGAPQGEERGRSRNGPRKITSWMLV